MRGLPAIRLVRLMLLLCVPMTLPLRAAGGQVTMALADRGPRFLLAPASGGAPVEVDASRSALLHRAVSLKIEGATVGRLLSAIESQTGLKFVYSRAVVPVDKPVGLRADSITVAAALTEILLDTNIDVLVAKDGQLTLVRRSAQRALADTGVVAGRVTDKKTGAAIAGATVMVEGTRLNATTGGDGRYRVAGVPAGVHTVRARYIGYSPGSASVSVTSAQEVTADFGLEKSAQQLNEVVTTGTVVPTEVKALPTPISVITGDEIQQKGYQRVDQVFRGDIPGAIAWDNGPGSDFASNIYVRGASSLSVIPTVKTFIDGVQVADPELIAEIDPNSVERLEVTRGPQASTVYGAGALNGVLQVFTKKGRLGLARPEVIAKLSAGGIGGFDGKNAAFDTDNGAWVLGGNADASYNLGGSYRRTGEWVPSYHSTDWNISGGGQTRQGPLSLSGSARYSERRLDLPWDTRFAAYTTFSKPPYQQEIVRQQTYGVTAALQATHNWQHTVTVGYDQSFSDYAQTQPRFTTPADSFLTTNPAHLGQTSVLYHTDLSWRLGGGLSGVVTAGVNYVAAEFITSSTSSATRVEGSLDGVTFAARIPSGNTGYFGQAQINLADRLFLTGGLRAERSKAFAADYGTAWSPRVGAAYVIGAGQVTVKLRASYGESIRAPDPSQRDGFKGAFFQYLPNAAILPERQHGFDGGIDLYLGRASLGVTYYSQRAIDLIQLIDLPTPPSGIFTAQWQNISRVKNEGLELEARLPLGPVQLNGTYSITNSTIQAVPLGPGGDYQVGDRLLGIPHTSAGLTLTYSPLRGTTLLGSMTHFGHWMGYDNSALYAVFYGGAPYQGSLRAYWIEYPTVTKLTIGARQELTRALAAFVRAENIGNNLRFEQDDSHIPTPRRVLVGADIRY